MFLIKYYDTVKKWKRERSLLHSFELLHFHFRCCTKRSTVCFNALLGRAASLQCSVPPVTRCPGATERKRPPANNRGHNGALRKGWVCTRATSSTRSNNGAIQLLGVADCSKKNEWMRTDEQGLACAGWHTIMLLVLSFDAGWRMQTESAFSQLSQRRTLVGLFSGIFCHVPSSLTHSSSPFILLFSAIRQQHDDSWCRHSSSHCADRYSQKFSACFKQVGLPLKAPENGWLAWGIHSGGEVEARPRETGSLCLG